MKKFLTTLLLMALCVCASAQDPDRYIQGTFKTSSTKNLHDKKHYTLSDIKFKGFSIRKKLALSPDEKFEGRKTSDDCVDFLLDSVKILNDKDGDYSWVSELDFEYWSEAKRDWICDCEAVQSAAPQPKDIVLTFVLDFSGSMNKDHKNLKHQVNKFVEQLYEFAKNNRVDPEKFHVGVVAFANKNYHETHTIPIIPLSYYNKGVIENTIEDYEPVGQTALYNAFEKATAMTKDYCKNKIDSSEFHGAFIITFTDGLDNASVPSKSLKERQKWDDNIGKDLNNKYLQYLHDSIVDKENGLKIMNKPIECYSVAYAGGNPEGLQRKLFKDVTSQLATDTTEHFRLAENFGDVKKFFNKALKEIMDNWLYLQLTVGESQDGMVRWHLPSVNYHSSRKIKRYFFGFGLGAGYLSQTYQNYHGQDDDKKPIFDKELKYDYLLISPSIDFAWGLSNHWYLGLHGAFHLGILLSDNTDNIIGFSAVPELLYRFNNNSALLFGYGVAIPDIEEHPMHNLRIGFKFKKGFFLAADGYFYRKWPENNNRKSFWGGSLTMGWSLFRERYHKPKECPTNFNSY